MYFKHIKCMQTVFQLQNENYFCYINKIENKMYMYLNYLYFNNYTTLSVTCIFIHRKW